MEFSRPAPALVFGRGQPLALKLERCGTRGRDGGRRARRERFQQSPVLFGEPRSLMKAVQRDQSAICLAAEHERDDESCIGPDAVSPETVLVKASAVELHLQPLRRACAQRSAGDRVGQPNPLSDQTRRAVPSRSGDN